MIEIKKTYTMEMNLDMNGENVWVKFEDHNLKSPWIKLQLSGGRDTLNIYLDELKQLQTLIPEIIAQAEVYQEKCTSLKSDGPNAKP